MILNVLAYMQTVLSQLAQAAEVVPGFTTATLTVSINTDFMNWVLPLNI